MSDLEVSNHGFELRVFGGAWESEVIDLFTATMKEIVPPSHESSLEQYLHRAIDEELSRLEDYYSAFRRAEFWILLHRNRLVATAGFEPKSPDTAELRRMLVSRPFRRSGVGSFMLQHCELRAQQLGYTAIELSTSVWQPAAIALYRRNRYRELRRTTAPASHRSIGAGVERIDFCKLLGAASMAPEET